jgi:hypothetical protein
VEKNNHGWFVRVRLSNTTKSKFFNDRKNGGKEEALQRAIEWRDKTEQEIGKPRTTHIIVGMNSRNVTGVVGVRRAVRKYRGKDDKIFLNEVYEVSWQASRTKMGRTCVSIKKYGEAEAFRRACAIRRKKESEMYGAPVSGKWAQSLSKICAA